ncbi:DUF1190 domain-containing protein [Methylorubrum salsuginis]|uniref:Uncharacterized conserved protein YgiB, involved in bioifilm formation, UPF0441/DUF1190 family n=1 Tax=Methylorubrum salsuginis TaxID=414703 RepID=A0A1I4GHS3_9HYPH|nr:DUF1190 domain-containing protein [Methylorubrum salsuginis]SFL28676.1 Uncharacterized conserved protein YgiB, involved in bioifilm formation, UPF0441/DUF1190 family [Methylorubrum salsuginis]
MAERDLPRLGADRKVATKRSQTVSTALVASAGLAAFGLGSLTFVDWSGNVLVYRDATACAAEGIRSAEDCRSAYDIARSAYPSSAPHYQWEVACESHHGNFHCQTDPAAAPTVGRYVPRMAGYVLGRRASDGVTPEPVYEHGGGHGDGHAGYCTGSGGRISTGYGGRASSGMLKSARSSSSAKFGGFGGSGKSFSSFGS